MTETELQDNRMIQEATMISQIHDYLSILISGLESHPDNEIMLQQHDHWKKIVGKLPEKFRKKYGRFPVSVVEEQL